LSLHRKMINQRSKLWPLGHKQGFVVSGGTQYLVGCAHAPGIERRLSRRKSRVQGWKQQMERTVPKFRKWNVWMGTTEELNRIAAEFESQATARRDAAFALADPNHPTSDPVLLDAVSANRTLIRNEYAPTARDQLWR
jgi:hypothetical protein